MYLPLFKEDKPHFHTSGGQLAVGFKIYTYLSGTDTPVQVYSDPSGATPYTNPIVLDGRGEPSGQGIYANPDVKYKVVFKTPDDAVVWSMDDISCACSSSGGGEGDGVFFAYNGVTDFHDILRAFNNGMMVYCKYRNPRNPNLTYIILPLVRDTIIENFVFVGLYDKNTVYSINCSIHNGWGELSTSTIPEVGTVSL